MNYKCQVESDEGLVDLKFCNYETNPNWPLKAHQLNMNQLKKYSFHDFSSPKCELRQHMKKHDVDGIEESDKILNLQHCNIEVTGKRYMKAHLQRKHRDQHIGDPSCKFCDYSSTLVTLGQHTYLKHIEEEVKIRKHCGFQTTSASELGQHRLDIHGNKRRRRLETDRGRGETDGGIEGRDRERVEIDTDRGTVEIDGERMEMDTDRGRELG